MPVTKTAKKALRQSKRKALSNKPVRSKARTLFKKALTQPTTENIKAAYSAIDKAVKKNIFHKNTGSRMKSRAARALTSVNTK